MKTKKALLAKQKEELKQLEREEKLVKLLPHEPRYTCFHPDHVSICYESESYHEPLTLKKAYEIYAAFASSVVPCEHWKDGCISTYPRQINSNATKPNATMDGGSWVELKLSSAGSRGENHFGEVRFWVMVGEELVNVSIKVSHGQWLPSVRASFNTYGDCVNCVISPKALGEDKRLKWWSSMPCYSLSYYWADKATWENWVIKEMEGK